MTDKCLEKKANTPKSFSFFNNTNSCQNGIHGVTEQTEHVYRIFKLKIMRLKISFYIWLQIKSN